MPVLKLVNCPTVAFTFARLRANPPLICALPELKLVETSVPTDNKVNPLMLPPATTRFATLKFVAANVVVFRLVSVEFVAVRFVMPVTLPPVSCALAETRLVTRPLVDVTSPVNEPTKVVAVTLPVTLPTTLPVSVPDNAVPTTLPNTVPLTVPVNVPETFEFKVVPASVLLRVIPGLIYVNPGIGGLGKNGKSELKVAKVTLPNCNFTILCTIPVVLPSLTTTGIAPLCPVDFVYSGPIRSNVPDDDTNS